jgi:hypothetical protein
MGTPCDDRTVAETQPMKRRQYYKRAVKRHYGGELRRLFITPAPELVHAGKNHWLAFFKLLP